MTAPIEAHDPLAGSDGIFRFVFLVAAIALVICLAVGSNLVRSALRMVHTN
jgi:hypothetical protein